MVDRREFVKIAGLGGAVLAAGGPAAAFSGASEEGKPAYAARDFGRLPGTPGFSETLLKNHLTLYQGYVTNVNKTVETLGRMAADGKLASAEAAELRRRLGWEWNGMRLHELYFENLGGKGEPDPGGPLAKRILRDFGGFEAWQKEFRAVGAMRGIGWAVLYQDPANGRLLNLWIGEHDVGHPAGGVPILILDVFEHAYMIDYGLKKADYIEAFFKAVDWPATEARLR